MRLGDATARSCQQLTGKAQIDGRSPSVVAAVLRDGEPVWESAVGDATVGREPATVDTRYRIGSITKTVTALMVLQLRDEGRLALTDRVAAHLPDAPLGDARLVDLLAHTAGAAREPAGAWWERNPGVEFAELAGALAEERVLPPRRSFHYSNLAYGVLGELVSRLAGGSWFDAARARVLEPLGMSHTTYLAEAPHATGYDVHPFADVVREEPLHDGRAMAPAGQLWSTVGDLLLLGRQLAAPDPAVLATTSVDEMCTPQVVADSPGWPLGYGLGVFLYRRGDRTLVGHTGSMPGFLAALLVDRSSGVGAAVLSNCYQGPDPVELAAGLVEHVLAAEPPLPRPWRPATDLPPAAGELVGHWYWGSSPYVVSWRAADPDDIFVARAATPDAVSRLVRVGADRWRGVTGSHSGELLDVVRDDTGAAREIVLSTYRMRREPHADA